MPDRMLITTSTEGFQPLGSAAQRSYELIHGSVRDRLGAEHAALFAEPVASEAGDRIDWYTALDGPPTPLSDLSEPDRLALRARLGGMIGDIRAEADAAAARGTPDDQRLSEALKNATEVPDEASIFAIRDAGGDWQPILVHWAWVSNQQANVRGVLSAMVPRTTPLADATPARSQMSPFWWWLILLGWLLLAAMLGAILYILIAPCGVNRFGLTFCPTEPPVQKDAYEEDRVLSDEISRLQRELALLDRSCQPRVPILPATPATPVTPAIPLLPLPEVDQSRSQQDRDAIGKRVTDRGASLGALNFVLEWQGEDDIDLYVTCPAGETISYSNREGCGGYYDLDANVAQVAAIPDPVENIVFENAALGLYKVRAHLRDNRTDGTKTVTLHVLRDGGPSRSYTGTIDPETGEWSVNISISR